MSSPSEEIDTNLQAIKDCLYRLSAKAVIVESQKLLMTLEHGDDWWSLPGGGVDYGETVQDSLAREISEELGIPAGTVRTDGAPMFVTTHAIVDNIPRAILYYRVYMPETFVSVGPSIRAHEWFSVNDFENLSLSPSIARILPDITRLM